MNFFLLLFCLCHCVCRVRWRRRRRQRRLVPKPDARESRLHLTRDLCAKWSLHNIDIVIAIERCHHFYYCHKRSFVLRSSQLNSIFFMFNSIVLRMRVKFIIRRDNYKIERNRKFLAWFEVMDLLFVASKIELKIPPIHDDLIQFELKSCGQFSITQPHTNTRYKVKRLKIAFFVRCTRCAW